MAPTHTITTRSATDAERAALTARADDAGGVGCIVAALLALPVILAALIIAAATGALGPVPWTAWTVLIGCLALLTYVAAWGLRVALSARRERLDTIAGDAAADTVELITAVGAIVTDIAPRAPSAERVVLAIDIGDGQLLVLADQRARFASILMPSDAAAGAEDDDEPTPASVIDLTAVRAPQADLLLSLDATPVNTAPATEADIDVPAEWHEPLCRLIPGSHASLACDINAAHRSAGASAGIRR